MTSFLPQRPCAMTPPSSLLRNDSASKAVVQRRPSTENRRPAQRLFVVWLRRRIVGLEPGVEPVWRARTQNRMPEGLRRLRLGRNVCARKAGDFPKRREGRLVVCFTSVRVVRNRVRSGMQDGRTHLLQQECPVSRIARICRVAQERTTREGSCLARTSRLQTYSPSSSTSFARACQCVL